jgi:hypothetical protein
MHVLNKFKIVTVKKLNQPGETVKKLNQPGEDRPVA